MSSDVLIGLLIYYLIAVPLMMFSGIQFFIGLSFFSIGALVAYLVVYFDPFSYYEEKGKN